MNTPLISIIVPVYNVEKYLNRCLNCIVNQSYKNLEIMLIDDGSADGSIEICKKYKSKDDRIVVIHQENSGVSVARNKGLDLCKGEYIAFVDSDDWVENDYIESMFHLAIKHNAGIAMCRFCEEPSGNSRYLNDGSVQVYSAERFDFDRKRNFMAVVWCALFERSVLNNLYFDTDIYFGEDTLFVGKAIKNSGRIVILNRYLYHYRINDSSLSKGAFDEKKYTVLKALDELRLCYKDNKYAYKTLLNDYIVQILIILSRISGNPYYREHYKKKPVKLLRDVFFEWNSYHSIVKRCFWLPLYLFPVSYWKLFLKIKSLFNRRKE